MKRRFVLNRLLIVPGLALILLAASATWIWAEAQSTASPANRPAGGGVDAFIKNLQKAGFSLQPGEFTYWDLVKDACEGKIPTAGNNPWPNAYVILKLAPHPGVMPPLGIERYWQLREDEAIVLVGQTPPSAMFFSYQVFAITVPEIRHPMSLPVGDSINNGTIKTIGPNKDNQQIVYIITGNRQTEQRVRKAALKTGYPEAVINVEPISPVIAPLGVGAEGSWFAFAHRVAVPLDKTAVEDYIRNPPYQVFRLTPDEPLKADPEPVPVLRVRGTGHTEMPLYSSLKRLRQAIISSHASLPAKELDTKVWQQEILPDHHEAIAEKPYVALQRGINVLGGTRDNNNLASYPYFPLRDGTGEFVMVYGANHQATGKVTYASFSIYVDKDRWFALKDGTTLSPDFGDSAKQYLCPDENDAQNCDPNWPYFYAWKVARDCQGEAYCMDVKVNDDPSLPFTDIEGVPFACNLYDFFVNPKTITGPFDLNTAEMFINWRSYMEPATNVGPDDNELLYDRAIYFGPYFAGQ